MSHADDYYANYGGMAVADYVDRHLRRSPLEAERLARMVALVPPDVGSVLDVGAGHGLLLEALKAQRGIGGVGIEITPAKVDYARTLGVDMRIGNAAALDFADGSFDAAVSCEVLEHLPFGTYEAALRELARVARRWVIVSVPFDERRQFVTCRYCGASVNPNYHFRSFQADTMAGLLPGFTLQQTLGLGRESHGLLKSWLRPWLSRAWPGLLVCPCCGWRPAAAPAAAAPMALADAASAPTGSGGLLRTLAAHIPTPGRPMWRVAVYRRNGVQP